MEVIEVRITLTSIQFKLLFLNISKVKFIQLNCLIFFKKKIHLFQNKIKIIIDIQIRNTIIQTEIEVKQLIFFNTKIHSIEQDMNWHFWKIIHIHTHIQFKLFLDSKVMFIFLQYYYFNFDFDFHFDFVFI